MGPEIIQVTVAAAAEGDGFSLLTAVLEAGPIGLLTMLLLLGFSIASWGIIALKFLALRQAQSQSVEFLDIFWGSRRLDEIQDKARELELSPIAQVFRAGYQELVKLKQREKKDDDDR